MAHPIRVGETIKLRFAFEGKEDASGVVVKAILRNGADTQIGSTLTLTHTGEGVFKNDSVAMPDTPIVTARYIVYQVDGITVHTSWPSTMDEFRKDLLSEAIISAELLATASSTTTNVRTNAAQANGFYDETVLIVINSAGIGVRRVTGYLNSNGAFTVTPALPFTPATGDRVLVLGQNANLSAVTLATATSSIATNLDTTISSRAPSATALSNVQWTNARAALLDFIDVAVSSRAPSATALSNVQWTNARAALLDFMDVAVSSRAPSATALSNVQWTNARAVLLDFIDVAVSSRESESSASTRATVGQAEHDATQAAIAGIPVALNASDIQDAMDAQGYTEARADLLDNLDVRLSDLQQASNSEKIVAVIDENGAVIANLSVVTDEKLVTIIED